MGNAGDIDRFRHVFCRTDNSIKCSREKEMKEVKHWWQRENQKPILLGELLLVLFLCIVSGLVIGYLIWGKGG